MIAHAGKIHWVYCKQYPFSRHERGPTPAGVVLAHFAFPFNILYSLSWAVPGAWLVVPYANKAWAWGQSWNGCARLVFPQEVFTQVCGFLYFFFSFSFLCSVQFSHSVVSDSLQPHESQHTRPPCPSPTPGVHSDSHPSSQWCHPAFSSSVIPFSSCPQSLPASESFPMCQLFAWGG